MAVAGYLNSTDIKNTAVNTLNKDIFVPEVYAGLVREAIKGKMIVSQFANVDTTLQGQPGETLVIPTWKYIGDSMDHTPGTPMDSTKLKQSKKQATIKMVAAPAVVIEDSDKLIEFGDQVNEAAAQQSISMARKLDTDCIAALLTAPLKSNIAADGKVTFDELVEAESLFGDDFNVEDVDAIVIHSAFKASFIKMEGFVNRDNTYVTDGAGIARNNCIGSFMGVPVVVTDRMLDGTKKVIAILKKGALTVITKEAPFVESERNASTRSTTIYCSDFYTVALVKDDAVCVMEIK